MSEFHGPQKYESEPLGSGAVTCVAYSPDGETVVSCAGDKLLKLWNATTGQFIRDLPGHEAAVMGVAYLPDGKRVVSVGRLDINSEGLLLLTNDGAFARSLELPAAGWTREYRVRLFGKVSQADLELLHPTDDPESAVAHVLERYEQRCADASN